MENVAALGSKSMPGVLDRMLQTFKSLGYSVVHGVLDASDYGAPQARKRMIFIGSRDGEHLSLPEPTHSLEGRDGLLPKVTVRDAIGDLLALVFAIISIFVPIMGLFIALFALALSTASAAFGNRSLSIGSSLVAMVSAFFSPSIWIALSTECHSGLLAFVVISFLTLSAAPFIAIIVRNRLISDDERLSRSTSTKRIEPYF